MKHSRHIEVRKEASIRARDPLPEKCSLMAPRNFGPWVPRRNKDGQAMRFSSSPEQSASIALPAIYCGGGLSFAIVGQTLA